MRDMPVASPVCSDTLSSLAKAEIATLQNRPDTELPEIDAAARTPGEDYPRGSCLIEQDGLPVPSFRSPCGAHHR